MKKSLFLIAISTFLHTCLNAQKGFGIMAGGGLSKKSGYKDVGIENTGSLFTVQASVFRFISIGEKSNWVFKPSLGYAPKGITFRDLYVTDVLGNDIGRSDYKTRVDYIQLDLPVGLQIKWKKNNRAYTGLGPYLAYAVEGRQRYYNYVSTTGTSTDPPPSTALNFKNNLLNRFDAGFTLYFTTVFSKHFCAGVKFDLGLAKINSSGPLKSYNRAGAVNIGYIF
jgi:hypothetical protein